MGEEARLEDVGSGLVPVTEGWFVVNARDAAWLTNDAFGHKCVFEADKPVVRNRPELEVHRFADVGVALRVLRPGQPSGLYHAESNQENFLVLAGECLLIVEGDERRLTAWDFVHCPASTEHVFVGAGEGPCVILMVGRRNPDRQIVYPVDEAARRRGASVESETTSAAEAYAPFGHWRTERSLCRSDRDDRSP
jgi:uncharacterized cupin superfamily protein